MRSGPHGPKHPLRWTAPADGRRACGFLTLGADATGEKAADCAGLLRDAKSQWSGAETSASSTACVLACSLCCCAAPPRASYSISRAGSATCATAIPMWREHALICLEGATTCREGCAAMTAPAKASHARRHMQPYPARPSPSEKLLCRRPSHVYCVHVHFDRRERNHERRADSRSTAYAVIALQHGETGSVCSIACTTRDTTCSKMGKASVSFHVPSGAIAHWRWRHLLTPYADTALPCQPCCSCCVSQPSWGSSDTPAAGQGLPKGTVG